MEVSLVEDIKNIRGEFIISQVVFFTPRNSPENKNPTEYFNKAFKHLIKVNIYTYVYLFISTRESI